MDDKSSEPAFEQIGSRQDQIALKYLDLARAEISDRMKVANQTLIVYVGGVGAIVGWMYQASIAPQTHTVQLSTLLFPIGVVVAFLSFAASWIIFHNERMVNALARYQKNTLAPYFKLVSRDLIAWESSDALHKTDSGLRTIATTTLVQAILIIGPNVIFVVAMLRMTQPQASLEEFCIILTIALTSLAFWFSSATIYQRRKLRMESR